VKKRQPKRVEQHEQHPIRARRKAFPRHASLPHPEQPRDRRRQRREAAAVIPRDDHSDRARLTEHLAQPRRQRQVALEVQAPGEQGLARVEVAAGDADEVGHAGLDFSAGALAAPGRATARSPSIATVQSTTVPSSGSACTAARR